MPLPWSRLEVLRRVVRRLAAPQELAVPLELVSSSALDSDLSKGDLVVSPSVLAAPDDSFSSLLVAQAFPAEELVPG